MPNRIVREGLIDSERVDALSPDAECLYHRLLLVCDDGGRFDGRINVIVAKCWPNRNNIRPQVAGKWLAEITRNGLAVCYEVDGKPYLQITNWQRCSNSKFSKYPDASGNFQIAFVHKVTRDGRKEFVSSSIPPPAIPSASHPDGVAPDFDHLSGDGDENTEKTKTETNESCSEPSEADASEPDAAPVMTFPVVGHGGSPKEWPLHADQLSEFRDAYPGIDPLAEAKKARQWCIANKSKRKTFGGMLKFLNSWMARAQNDAAKRSIPAGGRASGSANLFEREQTREQQQLDTISAWAAKRSGGVQHGGLRSVDGLPDRDEENRRIDGPSA